MIKKQEVLIFLLRVGLGWYMFWAGITKVLNPEWTSAGFLSGAQFSGFFNLFLSPLILPFIDFLNEWGAIMIGLSFIFGVGVRLSSYFGAIMLMLYYFAHGFPRPDEHTYIVNLHVIFSLVFLYLGSINAGSVYGLSEWLKQLSIFRDCPRLRNWM